jgi:hypothetical protein
LFRPIRMRKTLERRDELEHSRSSNQGLKQDRNLRTSSACAHCPHADDCTLRSLPDLRDLDLFGEPEQFRCDRRLLGVVLPSGVVRPFDGCYDSAQRPPLFWLQARRSGTVEIGQNMQPWWKSIWKEILDLRR